MVRAAAWAGAGSRRARLTAAKATPERAWPGEVSAVVLSRPGGPLIIGLRARRRSAAAVSGCGAISWSWCRRQCGPSATPGPMGTRRTSAPIGRQRDSAMIARDGRLSRFFRSVRRSHSANVRRCSACYVSFPSGLRNLRHRSSGARHRWLVDRVFGGRLRRRPVDRLDVPGDSAVEPRPGSDNLS